MERRSPRLPVPPISGKARLRVPPLGATRSTPSDCPYVRTLRDAPSVARRKLASVRSETNLCRAPGLWATGPQQLQLPLDATGLGVAIRANGRLLVSPDLDVLSWLCERWHKTRLPSIEGEHRADPNRVAAFTMRDLALDLYAEAGGRQRQLIRESLLRLFRVEITLEGYDSIRKVAGGNLASLDRIVERISTERGSLDADLRLTGPDLDAAAMGALRGDTLRVQLSGWLCDQLDAGNVTYLDWRTLRQLDGTAKRAYVYLEAESYKATGEGLTATAIGLGKPALDALGVGHYSRHRDARRALDRAGRRIIEADDRYHSIRCEQRPGGYALVAEKLDAERLRVRRETRQSLAA